MTLVTLYIWTIVAATPHASGYTAKNFFDWRVSGDFTTVAACRKAAEILSLPDDRFRCIRKDGA